MRRNAAVAVVTLAGLALAVVTLVPSARSAGGERAAEPLPSSVVDPGGAPRARPLRAVLVGTGSDPASTQVSIEQDISLAREVFPGPSAVLFAGGSGAEALIELPAREVRGLRSRLAAFFGAPVDPEATFRPTRLAADGPASRRAIVATLDRALASGEGPLVVYWAGHGEQGGEPRDNAATLWGGTALTPVELAAVLEAPATRRSAQLVMTTCFSGGFAELVFAGADPDAGPAARVHCGLFAAPWDDEASGCDPDPERARQEGFGLHFLSALRGLDRHGRSLAADAVDRDGDGAVSLLEAHAFARVASRGIEIPTTTSERFLRAAVDALAEKGRAPDAEARAAATALAPEDAWVARRLADELGLPSLEATEGALAAIDARMESLDARLAEAEGRADDAYLALRIALLSRWPSLDDPWNPRFEADLARDERAIDEVLERSAEAHEHARALAAIEEPGRALDALRARRARLERLARAQENLSLAAELVVAGSPDLARYEALLACERAAPLPLPRSRSR